MDNATIYALVSTAAATALLHTLIPDHWLPFVLIGRARRWPVSTVAFVSGLSALIHTTLSVLLGLGALWIGLTAVEAAGDELGRAGAVLLVVFGCGYALWAWRKGGHFHPGGSWLHHHDGDGSCEGLEGPGHPEHLHYHADDAIIRGKPGWSAVTLAVIVGLNPCILVLPLLLASASHGTRTVGLVALAYGVPTVLLMIGLSVLGVSVSWRIRLPGAARHMELATGLLIALLGVFFWLLEH